jgi:hypothetical protein
LRECNCKPKEGLGVRLTPGHSDTAEDMSVSRRAILLLTAALLLGGAQQASAQTTQVERTAPAQAGSDRAGDHASQDEHATTGMRQGNDSSDDDTSHAAREESRPPHFPVTDETVGLGNSIDRAPRDIREPFDE